MNKDLSLKSVKCTITGCNMYSITISGNFGDIKISGLLDIEKTRLLVILNTISNMNANCELKSYGV
jgi:hypothetical protein